MASNLISYIGPDNIALDDALPDNVEMQFTDIFSENISAMRNEDGEWVGSLAQLGWKQLLGYWVSVNDDLNFSYVFDESLPRLSNDLIVNYDIRNYI